MSPTGDLFNSVSCVQSVARSFWQGVALARMRLALGIGVLLAGVLTGRTMAADQADAGASVQQSPSRGGSLVAEIPEIATIEFLGLILATDKEAGWWAPDGSAIKVPQVEYAEVGDSGTVAAFRVRPTALHLELDFLRGSRAFRKRISEGEETWRAKNEEIILAAIDHPEEQLFGNIQLGVTVPGTRLAGYAMTPADMGKIRRVGEYGVEAFVLERKDENSFKVTVFGQGALRLLLAASDLDGKLHVPTSRSHVFGDILTTPLTFAFPITELKTIEVATRADGGVAFRNVALAPGVLATPAVSDRGRGEPLPEPADTGVARVVSVGRFEAGRLRWWKPDGTESSPVPGVFEADAEGCGTVVAVEIPTGWNISNAFTEIGKVRKSCMHRGLKPSPPVHLVYADEAGDADECNLVLNIIAGSAMIPQRIPLTMADAGGVISLDSGVIRKITRIEAEGPEGVRVTMEHRVQRRENEVGLLPSVEFLAIDKSGKEIRCNGRGGSSLGPIDVSFPVVPQQLEAIVVRQRRELEFRFDRISLQPGHKTELASSTRELPLIIEADPPVTQRAEVSSLSPLKVGGRVTDAATGKPIERFTVITGHNAIGDIAWQRHTAQEFSAGRYSLSVPPLPRPPRQADWKRFLRVEAEGYPAVVSQAIESTAEPVALDIQLDARAGIAGVVRDAAGSPLANATVIPCVCRNVQLHNNRFSMDTLNPACFEAGADGRFVVSEADDVFAVLAVHSSGYGVATIKDFREKHAVLVEPWARLEGIFRIGARPVPFQSVGLEFSLARDRLPDWNREIVCRYRVQTDADGHFEFPNVPGTRGKITGSLPAKYSKNGQAPSLSTTVFPKPGAATGIELGGRGRPVKGKAVLPSWFKAPFDWTRHRASLHHIEMETGGTQMGEEWGYEFEIKPDGSFHIDDVVDGSYVLMVTWYGAAESGARASVLGIGGLRHRFTMPGDKLEADDEGLDLGELEVQITTVPQDDSVDTE